MTLYNIQLPLQFFAIIARTLGHQALHDQRDQVMLNPKPYPTLTQMNARV